MLGEVISTSWENMPGSIFLSDNVDVKQAADFLIVKAKVLIRTSNVLSSAIFLFSINDDIQSDDVLNWLRDGPESPAKFTRVSVRNFLKIYDTIKRQYSGEEK